MSFEDPPSPCMLLYAFGLLPSPLSLQSLCTFQMASTPEFVLSPLCSVCMIVLIVSVMKSDCRRCLCSINENVLNFALPLLFMLWMKLPLVSIIKLGCISCICSLNEDISNFAWFPLCMVWMKFLEVTVLKLGCMHCISNMNENILNLEFSVPSTVSVIKLGCTHCLCCKR